MTVRSDEHIFSLSPAREGATVRGRYKPPLYSYSAN